MAGRYVCLVMQGCAVNRIGNSLALAEEHDWLVTFDDDFLSLVEAEGLSHAGIIFVRQAGRDIGGVVKAVDGHLSERSPDDRGISYA